MIKYFYSVEMPYKLRKAPKKDLYWVVKTSDGKHMSEDPIPKERAEAQMRALYASENLPAKYTAGLTADQKEKQVELIKKSSKKYKETGLVEDRPKVSAVKTRRSVHVVRFEKTYGFPITETAKVKMMFPDTDIDKILAKGAAAYASSGSRPNVSVAQWANARLASVLTGGPALKIDDDLVGPISMKKISSRTQAKS
jgi:hypothetical protein